MRRELLLLATFLFILSPNLFTTKANAATQTEPVLDSDGNELRVGLNYYIVHMQNGIKGTITLSNGTCPLNVAQTPNLHIKGIPVRFSPANAKRGVIRFSTDLNIKFSAATKCPQSTVWKINTYDPLGGPYYVTTGGVQGNPGAETLANWFKIEKFGDHYRLVHCPNVCPSCTIMCEELGYNVHKDGQIQINLTDEPYYMVIFMKA